MCHCEEYRVRRGARPVGRFAPTPSGEMHAGNALCALLAYLSVKSKGGTFLVRIEDLDPLRCPRASAQKILAVLEYLGLTSDEPPLWQSERSDFYRDCLEKLRVQTAVYPCFCSRAQLHAAEAPRLRDGGVVYAGVCRRLTPAQIAQAERTCKPCYRIAVPDRTVRFSDGVMGDVSEHLPTQCGDFILRRSDGVYAYQLAVVADDGASGVTEVVRGVDLLGSTARQIWLAELLGYRVPQYYHIPLVTDASGRKLSKSEGDGMTHLCDRYTPAQILGALAFAAGLLPQCRPATLEELVSVFSWRKVPRGSIALPDEFL